MDVAPEKGLLTFQNNIEAKRRANNKNFIE